LKSGKEDSLRKNIFRLDESKYSECNSKMIFPSEFAMFLSEPLDLWHRIKLKSSAELKNEVGDTSGFSCISALVLEGRLLLKAIPAALTISLSLLDYGNSSCSTVVIPFVLCCSLSLCLFLSQLGLSAISHY
jgi:hypothetical protein